MEECRRIQEVAGGCRVVIVCATSMEAEPVIEAMALSRHMSVRTKQVTAGELAVAGEAQMTAPMRVAVAISGCDKANAAHILTCLLQAMEPTPALVLQAGIAGALPAVGQGGGAHPGDVVLATKEIYADTGSSSPGGWLSASELGLSIARVGEHEFGNTFELDPRLVGAAASLLRHAWTESSSPRVVSGPCVTVSRISGLRSEGEELARRWGALAESMEGAAAAHICALYRVPFLEIRGISNMVVDRDRASWKVEEAVAAACKATLAICRGFDSLPLSRRHEGNERLV
ncbi:MAG TPA: futalosine hydrolase [Thermoleophilia bacterium]|nr:futalosine hydrolase [Thermoleophilia bacterium]